MDRQMDRQMDSRWIDRQINDYNCRFMEGLIDNTQIVGYIGRKMN